MKIKFFIFILVLGWSGAHAWAGEVDYSKIDDLITKKKYYTAFAELKSHDPEYNDPKAVAKMAYLATYYYAFCIGRLTFAFRDLSEDEFIEDVRGEQGSFQMFLFEVEKELLKLEAKDPGSGETLEAIGNFYYSGICQLEREKIKKASSYYERAEKLVELGYRANHNLGILHLQNKEFKKALAYLQKASTQNPKYGSAEYNLAFAYKALGKPQKAAPHAENAFNLYRDKKLKSEAALLAAYMNLDSKNKPKALEFAALANKHKHQNHYHILTILLSMYLEMGEVKLANERADELLRLDPNNSRLSEDALSSYIQFGFGEEFLEYLKRNIKAHADNSMALGNLFFQKGRYFYMKKENSDAIAAFKTAQDHFRKVADDDHPGLSAIKQILTQLENK